MLGVCGARLFFLFFYPSIDHPFFSMSASTNWRIHHAIETPLVFAVSFKYACCLGDRRTGIGSYNVRIET